MLGYLALGSSATCLTFRFLAQGRTVDTTTEENSESNSMLLIAMPACEAYYAREFEDHIVSQRVPFNQLPNIYSNLPLERLPYPFPPRTNDLHGADSQNKNSPLAPPSHCDGIFTRLRDASKELADMTVNSIPLSWYHFSVISCPVLKSLKEQSACTETR